MIKTLLATQESFNKPARLKQQTEAKKPPIDIKVEQAMIDLQDAKLELCDQPKPTPVPSQP